MIHGNIATHGPNRIDHTARKFVLDFLLYKFHQLASRTILGDAMSPVSKDYLAASPSNYSKPKVTLLSESTCVISQRSVDRFRVTTIDSTY